MCNNFLEVRKTAAANPAFPKKSHLDKLGPDWMVDFLIWHRNQGVKIPLSICISANTIYTDYTEHRIYTADKTLFRP